MNRDPFNSVIFAIPLSALLWAGIIIAIFQETT